MRIIWTITPWKALVIALFAVSYALQCANRVDLAAAVFSVGALLYVLKCRNVKAKVDSPTTPLNAPRQLSRTWRWGFSGLIVLLLLGTAVLTIHLPTWQQHLAYVVFGISAVALAMIAGSIAKYCIKKSGDDDKHN